MGKLLKIVAKTLNNERGRFARVCIQIDLQQPLVSAIKVGKTNNTYNMKVWISVLNVVLLATLYKHAKKILNLEKLKT